MESGNVGTEDQIQRLEVGGWRYWESGKEPGVWDLMGSGIEFRGGPEETTMCLELEYYGISQPHNESMGSQIWHRHISDTHLRHLAEPLHRQQRRSGAVAKGWEAIRGGSWPVTNGGRARAQETKQKLTTELNYQL